MSYRDSNNEYRTRRSSEQPRPQRGERGAERGGERQQRPARSVEQRSAQQRSGQQRPARGAEQRSSQQRSAQQRPARNASASASRTRSSDTRERLRAADEQTRSDVARKRSYSDSGNARVSSRAHDDQAANYRRGSYSARNAERASASRGRGGAHSSGGRNGGGKKKWLLLLIALVVIIAVVIVAVKSCGGSEEPNTGGDNGGGGVTTVVDQDATPTPFIASCEGVDLHSAVAARSLTEILIHNASYSYAGELTTQLAEATNVDVQANHGTGRDGSAQPTGDEWLTGEFIRTYRAGNEGPTMSAIDCGGPVGCTVYAPVSGTVVKVAEYDLYNNENYKDIQIHIRPAGRDDLDVVLIHLTDACVEVGDTVVGGVTPIAKIRDVYAYIGEQMQLKLFTAEGDNGNHTHIQVNHANDPEYHGLD